MKNVLLVFIGFVVGTISVFLFITHGVEKQLGKNEPVETKTEINYILGKKKECRDKGGHFEIKPYFENMFEKGYVKDEYSISCTKAYQDGNKSITETISDYKI